MNDVGTTGWMLVALGPVLAYVAFNVVYRWSRSGGLKAGLGAAATAALLWFVVVTDWLPPAWKSFWGAHSITAGVISTALGGAAAWITVDARNQHRRAATLYANWGNWLRGQVSSIKELIADIGAVPDGLPAYGHAILAARSRADLLVQQQWVASTYTVLLLRAAEHEKGLMNGVAAIRRHGTAAIRELTGLEAILQLQGDSPLTREDAESLWKDSLLALMNLAQGLAAHEDFVNASRFDAMASAGGRD